MDNSDLIAAFAVLTLAVLLYIYSPELSQGCWVP